MSKLIDADDFFMKMYNAAHPVTHGYSEREAGLTVYGIAKLLDKQPTVDAVKVVRCKDCRYASSTFALDHYCTAYGFEVDDDFYCASGKRRGVTE